MICIKFKQNVAVLSIVVPNNHACSCLCRNGVLIKIKKEFVYNFVILNVKHVQDL